MYISVHKTVCTLRMDVEQQESLKLHLRQQYSICCMEGKRELNELNTLFWEVAR